MTCIRSQSTSLATTPTVKSIEKLTKESQIICPECRETSTTPPGGVKDLPNNFFINNLMDEVTLKRKVEGEEKATCDLCVEKGLAVVLCPDCVMFLQ